MKPFTQYFGLGTQLRVRGHVNEHGRYHGKYEVFYYSGNIQETCYYIDGKLHGISKMWDDNTGVLTRHDLWANHVIIHDFMANKITEEELLMLCCEHGIRIPKGELNDKSESYTC